jgi:hypothetical protein
MIMSSLTQIYSTEPWNRAELFTEAIASPSRRSAFMPHVSILLAKTYSQAIEVITGLARALRKGALN